MRVNRWMNWTPDGSIFRDSAEGKPTKPSKPGSVGFDGAKSEESQKIRGLIITPEDSWLWIEERSAIMEIDGGLTREQADYRAFMEWFGLFVGGTIEGSAWLKPEI